MKSLRFSSLRHQSTSAVALFALFIGCGEVALAGAETDSSGTLAGAVTGIAHSGNTYRLTGWACATGSPASIQVEVYAGGPSGNGGALLGRSTADYETNAAVAAECHSTGSHYGYSVALPNSVLSQYGAQPIYVYGVPASGVAGNRLLPQSGKFEVPQLVWFTPLFSFLPDSKGVNHPYVQQDYMDLFAPNAPWENARDHTQVFKIYSQFVYFGSDADLRTVFAYLKANNMALAMEAGPLIPTEQCGGGIESFGGGPAVMLTLARRIKAMGGDLAFVGMDEPLYFGHYYSGVKACHSSIDTIIQQAGQSMQAFKEVFPDVQIGDIEPLNAFATPANADTWVATMHQWHEGFESGSGFKLAFFHDDPDWSVPLSRYIPQLQALLEQEDIPFGMIFDGTDNPASSYEWMASTEEHIKAFNHSGDAQAQHVIFQTWDKYPTHALPETWSGAETFLVDYFYTPEARLSPNTSFSKDLIVLPGGAVTYRSNCNLDKLGAVEASPANLVAYSYCLVLARAADPAGLEGWTGILSSHTRTLNQMLDYFFSSGEFSNRFSVGALDNSEFVTLVYGLLLFRPPTAAELAALTENLDSHKDNRVQVFNLVLASKEFATKNPILAGQ